MTNRVFFTSHLNCGTYHNLRGKLPQIRIENRFLLAENHINDEREPGKNGPEPPKITSSTPIFPAKKSGFSILDLRRSPKAGLKTAPEELDQTDLNDHHDHAITQAYFFPRHAG